LERAGWKSLAKVLIVRRPEWVPEHGDASRVTPNRASYVFALDGDFSAGFRAEPGERFLVTFYRDKK